MTIPKVSVLMAVRNGGAYLQYSVESILRQDMEDFEFLIVDDGSVDEGRHYLMKLRDARVKVFRSPYQGLVAALNFGFCQAAGQFIARMDADDVAMSSRLRVQIEHLESHPGTGVVCSDVRVIDGTGKLLGVQRESWSRAEELRDGLLYRRRMKPVIHPTVVIRRDVVERVGGYRNFEASEDRDLWLRALDVCEFDRLDETLLDYRIHEGGVSRSRRRIQEVSSAMCAVNWLVRDRTGIDMFEKRFDIFLHLAEYVRLEYEREVMPGGEAFRKVRSTIREGRMLVGAMQLAGVGLRYGVAGTPDGARRISRRLIDRAVEIACGKLAP